jgi:ribosome maturation factor RimP
LTEEIVSALQTDIEDRLRDLEPDVEVLLAEVVSGATLRLFIDHPGGVTLGLCERVSGRLNDYRDRYALEVSSPGSDRPLTKPSHFQRFVGRVVRLRLASGASGQRKLTGELLGADERTVTVAAPDGVVTLSYDQILR